MKMKQKDMDRATNKYGFQCGITLLCQFSADIILPSRSVGKQESRVLYITHRWANWIASTRLSEWLQNATWVVPTSQSIHIVSVSVVFCCAMMISLRILGLGASGRSVSQLVDTLVPWMYRAVGVLLLTGIVQIIAEPVRQFVAPVFWWKMLMILCVLPLTVCFARAVRHNAARWDAARRPLGAKWFALISLGLWLGIIFCGRFIGYTWELYL
jgi:hypothetical protein